ncbi:alpha/beta hydrolase [Priestia megaterium]|uniref:alpha/beta hydrolase n=1 Tax=Priestia megaterium TaxID=1404 RepID=UPI0023DAA89D|nr:alpha/beta fold hydrolase [Priestia megaterium]MDF2014723.1 alpha/beta fold hydrolase [Priestia megaterium]
MSGNWKPKNRAKIPLVISLTIGIQFMPVPTLNHRVFASTETSVNQNTSKVELERATWFLSNVSKGNTEEARRYFSKNLKKRITTETLHGWWSELTTEFGTVKQMGNAVSDKHNTVHKNVTIPVQFEKEPGMITIRFSRNGKQDDWLFQLTPPPISYPTPPYEQPNSYTEKEISIGKSPYQLPGTLTIPKHNQYRKKAPVVILVHGSGPHDQDETFGNLKPFRDLAVGLATHGIAVLRYEKRTYEHNAKISNEPKMTVDLETTDDAVLAVKAIAQEKDIDSRNIFILGHSQGAMMMPRILERAPKSSVRGSVLLAAPARPLPELMLDQFHYLASIQQFPKEYIPYWEQQFALLQNPNFSPNHPPKEYLLGDPEYWYDLAHWHPAEVAMNQTKPLLLLQGVRDFQVSPTADFALWQKNLANRSNVSFKSYSKLNHFFTEGEGDKSTPAEYETPANIPSYVIKDIAQWIWKTHK